MKEYPHTPEWFNGMWLNVVRRRRMLTKQELAARCGISAKRISRMESGNDFPDMETINLLALVLDWPAGIFFRDDPDVIDAQSVHFPSR